MLDIYYCNKWVTIYHGDCMGIVPRLDGFSAVVTDPPYELGFMGKSWDSKGVSFQIETWKAVRESCEPGAMMLSFGGTRTFHRIAVAIEDAGWELRDTIMWVYGSGFPKSLDISKAIDKQAGVEREVIGKRTDGRYAYHFQDGNNQFVNAENNQRNEVDSKIGTITAPATPEAQLWNGYGTALKPAYEPILVCMNPLDGTFAQNALEHGVAGINIDECRVGTEQTITQAKKGMHGCGSTEKMREQGFRPYRVDNRNQKEKLNPPGRFPANIIHDGSPEVMELFPETATHSGHSTTQGGTVFNVRRDVTLQRIPSSGSAARFFYCAKASKSERNKGCDGLESRQYSYDGRNKPIENPYQRNNSIATNNHPTVKPLALMEYLVKLVKYPESNLILDPFMGSGTTLLACIRLGIPCIGIDSDEHSCEIAARRCASETKS